MKSIGIELGMTNCVMAVMVGDRPSVLENRANASVTPCAFGRHKGRTLVGAPAMDRLARDPRQTVVGVLHLIGRTSLDIHTPHSKSSYPYEIVDVSSVGRDSEVGVVLEGRVYRATEILALILRQLLQDAEFRTNEDVRGVVVAAAAYLTTKQKLAIEQAGHEAGFTLVKLIDAPTAIAVAYRTAHREVTSEQMLLIVDVGDMNCDVSIVMCVDGTLATLSMVGDMYLARQFNAALLDWAVERVRSEHNVDPRTQPAFIVALRREVERAIAALTVTASARLVVAGLLRKSLRGELLDVDLELTDQQCRRLVAGDTDAAVSLVHQCLQRAHVAPSEIDRVLLVGHISRLPPIRQSLAEIFGDDKLATEIDSVGCRACGAAVVGARWCSDEHNRIEDDTPLAGLPRSAEEDWEEYRRNPRSREPMKHDPQEDNPELKHIFRSAEKEAERNLQHRERTMGYCHCFWGEMQRILREQHGINWKSPAEMNPGVLFD